MGTSKTGKILFFALGVLMVAAFSAFLVNKNLHDPRVTPPVISFTQDKIDFGEVKQGPQVQGEFEFKNSGSSTLEIKKVVPSCGCTGVVLDEKKLYQPGETGKIKFTFNTEGRTGVNEKTITVETNDPHSTTKALSFKCNIIVN